MIDSFRTEIDGHVDTMAERVVQLGGTALGTTPSVAKATSLAPYPTDIYAIKDHLAALGGASRRTMSDWPGKAGKRARTSGS